MAVRRIEGIELPMPGRHNVQNALAAIGVALRWACADETIRTGFAKFGGVKRRFTKVGEIAVPGGGNAIVIDDYGHHPVEIKAVLAAAREGGTGPCHRRGAAASLHPPA
jgi:UDP-N-acetylmuramate--alanine ligase